VNLTITNLTFKQIMSQMFIMTHNDNVDLFIAGTPATDALSQLAEGGNASALATLYQNNTDVNSVITTTRLLNPGDNLTVQIFVDQNFTFVSVASMMMTTNDAFAGISKLKLEILSNATSANASLGNATSGNSTLQIEYIPAWDAGTEANDQKCIHIPGPPCRGEGISLNDTANATLNNTDDFPTSVDDQFRFLFTPEGKVSVHRGIHDQLGTDLLAAVFDWRNPVAKLEFRSAEALPSASPSVSPSVSPSASPSVSPTASISPTASVSPTASASPSVSPTASVKRREVAW